MACHSNGRSCWHLPSWSPGSGCRLGTVLGRDVRDEPAKVVAQCAEPTDLLVELVQALPEQARRGFAGAALGLPQNQQLADVVQAQAEALDAPDEPQPVHGGVVVAAVIGGGARGRGQQTDPLVVADGVRRDPDSPGQRGDVIGPAAVEQRQLAFRCAGLSP